MPRRKSTGCSTSCRKLVDFEDYFAAGAGPRHHRRAHHRAGSAHRRDGGRFVSAQDDRGRRSRNCGTCGPNFRAIPQSVPRFCVRNCGNKEIFGVEDMHTIQQPEGWVLKSIDMSMVWPPADGWSSSAARSAGPENASSRPTTLRGLWCARRWRTSSPFSPSRRQAWNTSLR